MLFCIAVILGGCCESKESLIYERAKLLNIIRDDDGQIHMTVKLEKSGQVYNINDLGNYDMFMGNYAPSAEVPFVSIDGCENSRLINAWNTETTFGYQQIKIYLPEDYAISLFDD